MSRVHPYMVGDGSDTVESWHARQNNGQWIELKFDYDISLGVPPGEEIIGLELIGEGPLVSVSTVGPSRGSLGFIKATSVRSITY